MGTGPKTHKNHLTTAVVPALLCAGTHLPVEYHSSMMHHLSNIAQLSALCYFVFALFPFVVAGYQILGVPPPSDPNHPSSTAAASQSPTTHNVILRHLNQQTLEFNQQERERDGSVSMAGTPWGASAVLTDYLTNPSNGLDLQDKTIIELGAGIGICSVAAAMMGAKVIATDASSTSLQLIRQNAAKYRRGCRHPIEVLPLLWGDFDAIRLFPRPHIVLASDVVYHGSNRDSLRSTINAFCQSTKGDTGHNSSGSTEVILAHTWRTEPKKDEEHFQTYQDICGFDRLEVEGVLFPNEYQRRGSDGRLSVSIFRMKKRKI